MYINKNILEGRDKIGEGGGKRAKGNLHNRKEKKLGFLVTEGVGSPFKGRQEAITKYITRVTHSRRQGGEGQEGRGGSHSETRLPLNKY